jgi:hypothetical protein
MTPRICRTLLALPLLAVLAAPAVADERWREHERHEEWHGEGRHPHDFRGRDFHHFDERERAIWIGGRWHHDWYGGRFGWWWEVGGVWYFYPEPVYPYPTYIASEVVIEAAPPPPRGGSRAASPHTAATPTGGGGGTATAAARRTAAPILVLLRLGQRLLPLCGELSGGLAAGARDPKPLAPGDNSRSAVLQCLYNETFERTPASMKEG